MYSQRYYFLSQTLKTELGHSCVVGHKLQPLMVLLISVSLICSLLLVNWDKVASSSPGKGVSLKISNSFTVLQRRRGNRDNIEII